MYFEDITDLLFKEQGVNLQEPTEFAVDLARATSVGGMVPNRQNVSKMAANIAR